MPNPNNPYAFDTIFTYKLVDLISNEYMNPNVITTINLLPSTLSLYFLYSDNYFWFYIFLFVRLILDCLDGHVARKYNKVTEFGNEYDKNTDLIFYMILIIILASKSKLNLILILLLVITIFMLIERCYIPIISELFILIEYNTIIMVPLISFLFLYFKK